jgi:hypothetical protein
VRSVVSDTVLRLYASAVAEDDPYILAAALKGALQLNTYTSSDTVAPFELAVRYGRDMLGSEKDFGVPISFFGLVLQSRAGIVKGFRAYYDQSPTVSNDITQARYSARRFQVGRSFSFKLPLFIDHIDVTPKLGQWDVESRVVLADPIQLGVSHVLPISVANAMSIGIEAGLEFSAMNFVGHLWASRDSSWGGLPSYSGGSVEGDRYGFDGIFRLFELGERRSGRWLAPSVFVLKEDLAVVSNQQQSIQSGNRTIHLNSIKVANAMTYVGAGLGVIW